MPLDWLPGVTRTIVGADAGSYVSAPFRIVIHRTEGSTIAGAVAAYRQHNVAPHATVDLARRQVVQHSVFSRAARALQNAAGGVETNRLSCLQFEVIGFSARSGADSDDDLAWFGSTVLAPVMAAYGVQPVAPEFHGESCGWTLAKAEAPQRMAFDVWRRFNGVCGHQHVPENCVHPDTPILMADLTWKRAGDVREGEEIVSFDEETECIGSANGGRRFRRGVITRNAPSIKDSYRITTSQGAVTATADHPWLVRLPYVNRGSRIAWVKSRDLDPARHRIVSIGTPWDVDDSRDAGWMAGVLDADGHVQASGAGNWVGFGQVDGDVLDLFMAECDRRGYQVKSWRRDVAERRRSTPGILARQDFTDVRIMGGMWTTLSVLGQLRPIRLLGKAGRMWDGAVIGKTTGDVAVLGVEHVGLQPIASISTSTRTYIADGLLCHNSHWDPGAFRVRTALAAAVPPVLPSARPLATKATTTPGDDDMTPDQAQMLAEVHAELLKRLPNRAGPNGQAVKGADGSVTADTVLGFAANSDGYGFRAQARLENLEKSVAELSRALADALARLAKG